SGLRGNRLTAPNGSGPAPTVVGGGAAGHRVISTRQTTNASSARRTHAPIPTMLPLRRVVYRVRHGQSASSSRGRNTALGALGNPRGDAASRIRNAAERIACMARLVGEGVARSAGRKTPKNDRAGDFIATFSI